MHTFTYQKKKKNLMYFCCLLLKLWKAYIFLIVIYTIFARNGLGVVSMGALLFFCIHDLG